MWLSYQTEIINLSQPHLIEQIIEESKVSSGSQKNLTPAASTKLITPYFEGNDFSGKFVYHTIIGRLNFLEKTQG